MADKTAPEYLDRLREMANASSPVLKLRQSIDLAAPGASTTPEQPQEISADAVREVLQAEPVDLSAEGLTKSAEGAKGLPEPGKIPKPTQESASEAARARVTEVLNEPLARRALNYTLKTAIGMDLDQLHRAVVEGTLPEHVGRAVASASSAGATVVEDVARETAQRSGLSPEVAAKVAAAAGVVAGFLSPPPGGKGKVVVRGAGVAAKTAGLGDLRAIFADEAGALFPRAKRRLVRVESVTPTEAQQIIDGGGVVASGRHLKVDWSSVDSGDEIEAILNRVAEVGREHWIDAKRGVIKDDRLAALAKREGIDLIALLRRPGGMPLSAEQQLAALMAAGDLATQAKAARDAFRAAATAEDAAAAEGRFKHLVELMVAMVTQVRASASEQGRALRVSGMEIPGLQEARRTTDLLDLMGGGRAVSGMTGRELAEATEGLNSPQAMWTWATWMRAGLGALIGGGFGAQTGEGIGGTPGGVAGAVGGAAFGAAAGINPKILLEAWINGILSGPPTYIVNVVSEGASTINGLIERQIAATHGSAGSPERVVAGEAITGLHAIASWMMDSLRTYGRTLAGEPGRVTGRAAVGALAGAAMSGEDTMPQNVALGAAIGAGLSGKVFLRPDELMRRRELSADALGLTGSLGRFADVVGSFVRLPSRALVQADDWIKAGNVQAELWMQAHRGAIMEGIRPGTQEYRDFITHARAHPSSEVFDAAQDYASYIAFQAATNAAMTGGRDMNMVLRFIAPFVMTPYNIAYQAFERMPVVNLASGKLRADLAAGGVVGQLAQAKIDMGIATAGLAWYLAASGFITGAGPFKKEYRAMREAAGRPPDSIILPGTDIRIAYNRLDPWSLFVGTIATIQEMSSEMDEPTIKQLLGATIMAFGDEFLSKTFVAGPARLIEAIDEAYRSGNFKPFERYVNQQAGTVVPNVLARASQAIDPAKTEVLTAIDAMRARLRGFSAAEDLPGRLDIFGHDLTYPHVGIEVLDAVNPFYIQRETADDKIKFIQSTLERDKVAITGPRNTIGGAEPTSELSIDPRDDPGVRLTPVQENAMIRLFNRVEIGGATWKDALYDLLRSDQYRDAGRLGKNVLAKRLTAGYRKLAEAEFLERYPTVAAQVEIAKVKRANLMVPGAGQPTPAGIIEQLTGTLGR